MMSEEEPGQVQVMSEEEPGQVQVMSEEATPGWVKVQGRFYVEWHLRSQNYGQELRPVSVSSGWLYTVGSLWLALKSEPQDG